MLKILEDEECNNINKKIEVVKDLIEKNELEQSLFKCNNSGSINKKLEDEHESLVNKLGESIDERMKVVEKIFN